MRYLKKFDESVSITPNIEEIQRNLIEISRVENVLERCTIRGDGTVDVRGSIEVFCDEKLPVKFGHVSGRFKLSAPMLTTLEGSPTSCESFECSFTKIKSLVGGPQKVIYNYDCSHTLITDLVGSPENVISFSCNGTPITSLKGSPKIIVLKFQAISVHNLTDLVGGPESVGSKMHIFSKNICSYEGAPKNVDILAVSSNRGNLKDPRGLEQVRVREMDFTHDRVDPISFLWRLFFTPQADGRVLNTPADTTKKFIDSLVYNYLRGPKGNPYINLYRLKQALDEIDLQTPYLFRSDSFFAKNYNPNGLRTLPGYDFVDEEGRVVDFDGNPI